MSEWLSGIVPRSTAFIRRVMTGRTSDGQSDDVGGQPQTSASTYVTRNSWLRIIRSSSVGYGVDYIHVEPNASPLSLFIALFSMHREQQR